MEKHCHSNCHCSNFHKHDYSPCHAECCSNHNCCCGGRCRRDLCSPSFRTRLGGLQSGLNFRLRELLWCNIKFGLEDGNEVKGRLISVGSNFVEILLESALENENCEIAVKIMDKESIEENKDNFDDHCEYCNRHHNIGRSIIFSTDKIAKIEIYDCHHPCTCN